MNVFLQRPLLRFSSSGFKPALRRFQAPLLHIRPRLQPFPNASFTRPVASLVSGRPGSQTLDHAALNVKEELGNSAADLAKVIAGANVTDSSVSNSSEDSFVSHYLFLWKGV